VIESLVCRKLYQAETVPGKKFLETPAFGLIEKLTLIIRFIWRIVLEKV